MDGLTSDLPQLGSDTLETRAQQSGAIWEARQRARQNVTDAFDTIDDPREVPIRRRDRGFGPSEDFLGWAEPQEAAHDLNPRFPNQDLGPQDVERTPDGQGFRAREEVQRTSVAFGFEEQTPLEDVDPMTDLVERGGGFGLTEPRQRDAAAAELDDEYPNQDLTRDDVQKSGDGYGVTDRVRRTSVAFDLDPEFPDVDIGAGDVTQTDSGFGLTSGAQREIAAERFEDDYPGLGELNPSADIEQSGDGFELSDSVIEENRSLFL